MTTVAVTGASGYIASWIVKVLLQRGYTVKASVRDPSDPKKTEHLRALDGGKGKLHLVKADLLTEGAFDELVAGCEGVFHTASPFFHKVTDPEKEMIDPAVKGTLNVLASCAKTPSVRRVVLTSSMAAIGVSAKPFNPEEIMNEESWSDVELCRKFQMWYILSKTLAEKAAWDFAEKNGIDLCVINPGLVIGPLLQPTLNTSAREVLDLINGAETYVNDTYGWVNVKDVAEAHIFAFENPAAKGRYCLLESIMHHSKVVEILRELYPTYKIPTKCVNDDPHPQRNQVSKEKAESLGVKFIPLKESLKETVESLIEKGFFTPPV